MITKNAVHLHGLVAAAKRIQREQCPVQNDTIFLFTIPTSRGWTVTHDWRLVENARQAYFQRHQPTFADWLSVKLSTGGIVHEKENGKK